MQKTRVQRACCTATASTQHAPVAQRAAVAAVAPTPSIHTHTHTHTPSGHASTERAPLATVAPDQLLEAARPFTQHPMLELQAP
jgi:hypothetical protein